MTCFSVRYTRNFRPGRFWSGKRAAFCGRYRPRLGRLGAFFQFFSDALFRTFGAPCHGVSRSWCRLFCDLICVKPWQGLWCSNPSRWTFFAEAPAPSLSRGKLILMATFFGLPQRPFYGYFGGTCPSRLAFFGYFFDHPCHGVNLSWWPHFFDAFFRDFGPPSPRAVASWCGHFLMRFFALLAFLVTG